MPNCVISQFAQLWLWLVFEIFHHLVPFSHVNSHGTKDLRLTASRSHTCILGYWDLFFSRLRRTSPIMPGEHLQQDWAQAALWIPHKECKSHRSPRREGPWVIPCNPTTMTLSREPGADTGEALLYQECLGLMQWCLMLLGVTSGREHWQRHWQKSVLDVSVRTFWTLPLQIKHLLSLFLFAV